MFTASSSFISVIPFTVDGNKVTKVVNFTENNVFPIVADPSWSKIGSCELSITYSLGSGLIVAAKINKIKKYIKLLGGVKESASLIVGASTSTTAERMEMGGTALVSLVAEITGIAAIHKNCF